MANLQQIANSLMQIVEANTATLKQAEFYLEKASKEDNFISILLSIPLMDDVSPKLAQIATTYSLVYARNLVLWRNQAFINKAAQLMLQFIAKSSTDFKYKDQVGAALSYLIQKDQQNIIISAFIPNMIDTMKQTMLSPTNQINFQFLATMSESLVDKVVPASGGQVETYIYQSFICLSYLVSKVLEYGASVVPANLTILERAFLLATKMLKVLKKYIKKFMFFSPKLIDTLYSTHFNQVVTTVLNFRLPENRIDSPIFYVNKNCTAMKLMQLFHCMKSLIIYILSQSFRLMMNGKGNLSIDNSPIFGQYPNLINVFVNSIHALLQDTPYFKLKSKQVFKIIQEIYSLLVGALRSGKFYQLFNEIKSLVIFTCIFKTLAFTPEDYNHYYHDPEQFINSVYHVVELDTSLLLGNEKNDAEDESVDIEIFDTLKTHSANLLKSYSKYIDGALAEIWFCVSNVIEDKLNVECSKNLMFLIACILKDEIKVRTDFLSNLRRIIFKNLQDLEIPTKNVEQPYNIQYTLSLLVLEKYVILFDELLDGYNIAENSFSISETILKNNKTQQVPRIIASEIISNLLKTEESSFYCRRTIQLMNSIMSANKISARYLECIETVIKENDCVFKNDYQILIVMAQKISAFLQSELKKQQKDIVVVTKLWHILENISESKELGVLMVETLKRCLQPLINMINGDNELDLEERVYKIMQKMIKITGVVGQFEIQIFSILPKTFYSGKKKYSFSTSFYLLQLILEYGKDILSSDIIITKNLILLCLENISSKTVNEIPRSENESLEGIWTLQGLIISIGSIFTKEVWVTITSGLTEKLKNETFIYGFTKSALVATLALILQMGFRYFSMEDNQLLIQLILKQCTNLTSCNWSSKIFIISISNLLKYDDLPFVTNRFSQLLDITITLLKFCSGKKQIAEPQMSTDLDQIEKQYYKLASKVTNCYKRLDEFEFFKSIIQFIKQSNCSKLEVAYNELPETKQQYLRELMNMRRVNEKPRFIYKMKIANSTKMQSS